MSTHGVRDDHRRCAWCKGPLSDPAETFTVVRGSDGEVLVTCSVSCLAEWLNQGTVGLRRSIRRGMDRGWRL